MDGYFVVKDLDGKKKWIVMTCLFESKDFDNYVSVDSSNLYGDDKLYDIVHYYGDRYIILQIYDGGMLAASCDSYLGSKKLMDKYIYLRESQEGIRNWV